ncbi:MAG: hypothetical protein JXM71_08405 [Spirochaetales bacterium]|nr:hypothetical protein [Spirochaetales bacterium]
MIRCRSGAGVFALALALLHPVSSAGAQESALRVVVLPFEAQAGVSEADAAAISEMVRSTLAETNEFALIEDQASRAILDESGFMDGQAGVVEASRLLAERLDAAYALSGAMSAQEDTIVLSARLIDAATARVIFVHQETSPVASIHRNARLFAEGIANEVVAMTAGATIENIQRLIALDRLDEASIKLDAARTRSARDPEASTAALKALGLELDASLAARSYRDARTLVARAARSAKDQEARDGFMVAAREAGTDALFLVPDGPTWARQREQYLAFMRDSVMSYFASEDKSRRAAIAERANELVKRGDPDSALNLLRDYIEVAGERSIDRKIKTSLDTARETRANHLYSSARVAAADGDYSMAERLLRDASSTGMDPARFAAERRKIESMQRRDVEAAIQAERFGSSSWDPAARQPWTLSTGIDLSSIDTPTVVWPLGGMVPLVRVSGAYSERVAGPILFTMLIAAKAGGADWEGALDVGEAVVSYWKADASAFAGFTVAFYNLDVSAGAAAMVGVGKFSGTLDAYGTSEIIEETLAPYLGTAVRGGIRYKPDKTLGFGIDLERSIAWGPGSGVVTGITVGLMADLTL